MGKKYQVSVPDDVADVIERQAARSGEQPGTVAGWWLITSIRLGALQPKDWDQLMADNKKDQAE